MNSRQLKRFEKRGCFKKPNKQSKYPIKKNRFEKKLSDLDFGDFGICDKCIDCNKFKTEVTYDYDDNCYNKETVCYDCLVMCSYCKVNKGTIMCSEGSISYIRCDRTICDDCKIYSNCNKCDSVFCKKHSLNSSFVINEFINYDLVKYIISFNNHKHNIVD